MAAEPLVSLRELRESDRADLSAWLNSADLARKSAPYRPVHAPAHERWFAELGRDPSHEAFGIEERATGRLVGLVQLVGIDPVHRNAEMRIRIGPADARGRGFGRQALGLLLDHAWRDLNLHRVWAHVFASNEQARAAYARVGFVEEGTLREAAFIDGRWTDIVVVGVLLPQERLSST